MRWPALGLLADCHFRKEEDILFPFLRERRPEELGGTLDLLERQHLNIVAYIPELSLYYDVGNAASFAEKLMFFIAAVEEHLAIEEDQLYAKAGRFLYSGEEEALSAAFEKASVEEDASGGADIYKEFMSQLREAYPGAEER